MALHARSVHRRQDYTVACICPMGVELAPVAAMLDETHDPLPTSRDQKAYTLGKVHGHNVVIAGMPEIGNNVAATVATQLLNDFPSIRFGLLVGIGGGVAGEADVRLGDVVVSKPTKDFGGVVQYDLGKWLEGGQGGRFERTGSLNKPPALLSATVQLLQSQLLQSQHRLYGQKLSQTVSTTLQKYAPMRTEYSFPAAERDQLFLSDYKHQHNAPTCDQCDDKQTVARKDRPNTEPQIHYGTIGSANAVVKDATLRDDLYQDMHLLCVEMEAAGIMNDFPCLVIRGICDYADSHKNKKWQGYAALVAASYARDLLGQIPTKDVQAKQQASIDANALNERSTIFDVANLLRILMTILFMLVVPVALSFWRPNVSAGQYFKSVVGDGHTFNNGPRPVIDLGFTKPLGFCLDQAPYIDASSFVGRAAELNQMHQLLKPDEPSKQQQRLVLGGVGGIGKTQLAIAYARQESDNYDTVLWGDATSEATLRGSYGLLLRRFLDPRDLGSLSGEEVVTSVKKWLSDRNNTKWLLVLDSYDNPISYDLSTYQPYASHGSIIITTRLPSQVQGRRIDVKPLDDVKQSLQVLQTRSQRENVSHDYYARRLAERLGGLPLALASAGAYMRHSALTFEQYLQVYEARWNIDPGRPLSLPDYQNRTLHTTWDLSYRQLVEEDPDAAQMLKLFAYFGYQSISFELLQGGKHNPLPQWLRTIVAEPVNLDGVMRKLVSYCLIEVQLGPQTYSMHTCVHDWSLQALNHQIESWSYWYAFDCVAGAILLEDWEQLGHLRYTQLASHAARLTHVQFTAIREVLPAERLHKATLISHLLHKQGRLEQAEKMYKRALAGKEKVLEHDHTSTLDTVNNLGVLYADQGKLEQAEKMYKRALAGKEQALGRDHTSTLDTVNNLGILYRNQGKLEDAEQMYKRALAGYEKVLGRDHTSTLDTVNNLGVLYRNQGKLEDAEQMYKRALAGKEKVLGRDHILTLGTVNNLGVLYRNQGKLEEAEQMYKRALAGYKKTLGLDHLSTQRTARNLGLLGKSQS